MAEKKEKVEKIKKEKLKAERLFTQDIATENANEVKIVSEKLTPYKKIKVVVFGMK